MVRRRALVDDGVDDQRRDDAGPPRPSLLDAGSRGDEGSGCMEGGTDDLRRTLADVAERIARYRDARIGEQNTKATLIAPVLRALGWNVEDLDEVHLEYRYKSQDKPVDYALMLQRKPRAVHRG